MQWVDEAFPDITTDLVLVRNLSTFGPEVGARLRCTNESGVYSRLTSLYLDS